MSIVSDDLFAIKIKQLEALKKEINEDRIEVYQILGEWLAHALNDDHNTDLQKIFMTEHKNPKYVRLKKDQKLLASIVENMELKPNVSVAKSGFTPPKSSDDAEELEYPEAAILENSPSVRDYENNSSVMENQVADSPADNRTSLENTQDSLSFDNNQTDRSGF